MDTEQKLRQLFALQFRVDPGTIHADTSPRTLGVWDSMRHVELILEVEDQFGVAFEAVEVFGLDSFANILRLLEDKLAQA